MFYSLTFIYLVNTISYRNSLCSIIHAYMKLREYNYVCTNTHILVINKRTVPNKAYLQNIHPTRLKTVREHMCVSVHICECVRTCARGVLVLCKHVCLNFMCII